MQQNISYKSLEGMWGSAVDYVRIDKDGKMWVGKRVGNGRYESQVNFCPFTGVPSPTQMKVIDRESYKEYINE